LLALAHGCQAISVDGSQDSLNFLHGSLVLNKWEGRATLVNRVVSDEKKIAFNGWSMAETPTDIKKLGSSPSQEPIRMDELYPQDKVFIFLLSVSKTRPSNE